MAASKQLPLPQVAQPDAVTGEAAKDPTDLENEIENPQTQMVLQFSKEAAGLKQQLPPPAAAAVAGPVIHPESMEDVVKEREDGRDINPAQELDQLRSSKKKRKDLKLLSLVNHHPPSRQDLMK